MFCIYKTDSGWIKTLRTLNPDIRVNFWRKGTTALKIPFGSWFYFNERRTRNVVGRGLLVGYEILTIEEAWQNFGIGNGTESFAELERKVSEVLGVKGRGAKIGCIVLSELQFLHYGDEYIVNTEDYAPQIVGPKYFEDTQLPELANKFLSPIPAPSVLREPEGKKYFEGGEVFSYRVGYERSLDARQACIRHYGYMCQGCLSSLEKKYGSIAQGFIHIHHLNQIAGSTGVREVDPINDLVPLCPNCHAMVHRRSPPFTIEELRRFIAESSSA